MQQPACDGLDALGVQASREARRNLSQSRHGQERRLTPALCVLIFYCRGLQVLFYPTAIGSEPQDPKLDSYEHWTRVMCGHAGANLVCILATRALQAKWPCVLFQLSGSLAGAAGGLESHRQGDHEHVLRRLLHCGPHWRDQGTGPLHGQAEGVWCTVCMDAMCDAAVLTLLCLLLIDWEEN